MTTSITNKTRKRKKKSRYHTGVHKSPKCLTDVHYRSGWEYEVCKFLDSDDAVLSYGYECLIIPYISNPRAGKMRKYYPDFLVCYKDGTRKLIEVKRKDKVTSPLVMKKSQAALVWCAKNNCQFELWTNDLIAKITKSNELNESLFGSQKKKL